jgi:tetratricopeptide (TPR) repeat protein
MKSLPISILLLTLGTGSALAQTTTNDFLFRQLQAWDSSIEDGQAAQVLNEIEASKQDPHGASWETPVFAGPDWNYNWGYLRGLAKARAHDKFRQPVEAYRALVHASGMMPAAVPPPGQDAEYWELYLASGRQCANLTRFQDAEWYFNQVRSRFTTNDDLYWQATAELAGALDKEGRLDDADPLYRQLFQHRPDQPAPVWKAYVQFLFNHGQFENGAEAILRGAERLGLSPRHGPTDVFAAAARQYWLFFSDVQIARWYELLGRQLETAALAQGDESYLSFLANTRILIQKIYPDLIGPAPADLAALKRRSAVEPPPPPRRPRRPPETAAPAAAFLPPQDAPGSAPARPLRIEIEDAVNRTLQNSAKAESARGGDSARWQQLLDRHSTNDLLEIRVDGMNVLFHVYAGLGGNLTFTSPQKARPWLLLALDEARAGNNPVRLGDVLLNLAETHLNPADPDPDQAIEYLDRAQAVVRGNARLEVRALSGYATVLKHAEGAPDSRIAALLQVVDEYGCLPRRHVYERLAADCYRSGDFREGFDVFMQALMRTPIYMDVGDVDRMADGLYMNRSFHTSAELARLRRLYRASALRFPATVGNAVPIARLLDLADVSWIRQHEELARLEENGTYADDDGWAAIAHALADHPSIRAGRLHALAALERASGAPPDWSGWLAAWALVRSECASAMTSSPVDSGGAAAAYGQLLDLLLDNLDELSADALAQSRDLVRADAGALLPTHFARALAAFAGDDETEQFRFQLARARGARPPEVPNYMPKPKRPTGPASTDPVFAALVALYPRVPEDLQKEFTALLNDRRNRAGAAHKASWTDLLRRCGQNPVEP